jgi:pSer/pThr/pTyr-binding forkhead associated (FHA) protein
MKTLRLHIHDGARAATLVFSRFPVLVGRDPHADCRLEFPVVSRHHARIDLRDGRLLLCDEGSSLGTWVHNQSRRLPVGVLLDLQSVADEFWIGSLRLRAELREIGPVEEQPASEVRPQFVTMSSVRPEPARADTTALRALQLLEGVSALRYGYRCERGAPPARGPNRAELSAAVAQERAHQGE